MSSLLRALMITSALLPTVIFSKPLQHYAPDDRTQLPAVFDHSYFGMSAGYTDIPYNNRDLINGLRANSFTTPSVGLQAFLGHFFNPHIALQISLMRPIHWAYAHGVLSGNDKHSIWVSLFGVTARPTIVLSKQSNLYGIAGLGIVSRHGFDVLYNGTKTNAIPSADLMTLLTGAGYTYAITPHWHFDTGFEYALARHNEHQPGIFYGFAGFYYLFTQLHLPDYYNTHYIFQNHLIQFGAFQTSVFHPDINRYFTIHGLPIFWSGDLKLQNGQWVMYEKNVFHTHKVFAINVGVSVSNYHTHVNNTNFQAFSVFPDFRFFIYRAPHVDLYVRYEIAGPSYLTRYRMDNLDLGGHFTFQDLLGLGLFLGHTKQWNLDFTIGHYSNGNLLPNNPGVEVPMMVSLGYAFE